MPRPTPNEVLGQARDGEEAAPPFEHSPTVFSTCDAADEGFEVLRRWDPKEPARHLRHPLYQPAESVQLRALDYLLTR